jgi:hypothetical protein
VTPALGPAFVFFGVHWSGLRDHLDGVRSGPPFA